MNVFSKIEKMVEKIEATFIGDSKITEREKMPSYRVSRDDNDQIEVEVDLPGVTSIEVFASDHRIIVEWKRGTTKGKVKLSLREARVDPTATSNRVTYVNGVLSVSLQKTREHQLYRIFPTNGT